MFSTATIGSSGMLYTSPEVKLMETLLQLLQAAQGPRTLYTSPEVKLMETHYTYLCNLGFVTPLHFSGSEINGNNISA